jgi:hypothetical protein
MSDRRLSIFVFGCFLFALLASCSQARNLVPSEPGKSPNYWCTWAAQNYMYGQGAKEIDSILFKVESIGKYSAKYLNEEDLFGNNSWLMTFHQKVKNDLWVVLDDGWDIPVNTDFGYRNYSLLDPEKFPTFKGSIPQNLVTLNERVKECGWRGVGLWYRAYEPAVDSLRKKTFGSEEEYKKTFWRERLEWSKNAGIGYWKMDMGGNDSIYEMMTRLGDENAPGIIIEYGVQAKDGPFNSYPGNGLIEQEYIETAKKRIQYSEVLRLYDISPQLGIPTTLERMSKVLEAVKTKPGKTGYLNCDDEVYIAAVLGGTMGILRHSMVGLRPEPDPDIYLKSPRQQKRRLDEVVRAVRWQRIAPAFGAGVMKTFIDPRILVDTYKYPQGEFWTSAEDWSSTNNTADKIVQQGAPAIVSLGLPLPMVKCKGEPPFVLASRNPNGAITVGSLGRVSSEKGYYCPKADVTLQVGQLTGKIGVFGYFKTLTIVFEKPLGGVTVYGQDLAGAEAIDITKEVKRKGNRLVLSDDLIKKIGLSAATYGDLSDPAMVIEIVQQ